VGRAPISMSARTPPTAWTAARTAALRPLCRRCRPVAPATAHAWETPSTLVMACATMVGRAPISMSARMPPTAWTAAQTALACPQHRLQERQPRALLRFGRRLRRLPWSSRDPFLHRPGAPRVSSKLRPRCPRWRWVLWRAWGSSQPSSAAAGVHARCRPRATQDAARARRAMTLWAMSPSLRARPPSFSEAVERKCPRPTRPSGRWTKMMDFDPINLIISDSSPTK
jgi:hypothetical protein